MAGSSFAIDMGHEVQFMFCFKAKDTNLEETGISFIDPADGSIQSGSVYEPMIKKVGASFVYPSEYLVYSGGAHFMALEPVENKFLVWEFPVGLYFNPNP